MGHRELDSPGPHLLGEACRAPAQLHARFWPADDLDLLPGEVHAAAERLPDRLLRGEAARVVLRRVRLRVAVRLLRSGEAALAKAVAVAIERPPDTVDLDQVDADAH